jgi:hypothetical protein
MQDSCNEDKRNDTRHNAMQMKTPKTQITINPDLNIDLRKKKGKEAKTQENPQPSTAVQKERKHRAKPMKRDARKKTQAEASAWRLRSGRNTE